MTSSSPSIAARERAALADLLGELGPDAPTCCAGWTTGHLAAHLVVRDRRPDALPGYGLEQLGVARPLSAWSHRLEDRLRTATPHAELVARVRSGPPGWAPMGWPGVGDAVNATEFAIHHEDVRRAQPGWVPRALPPADQDQLWRAVRFFARRTPGGVVLRRTDTGAEHRAGAGRTAVAGEPLELLLWAAGRRDVARVDVG
ncbi:TIGR03085 family metal-binding protein [Geodermatophilus sp. SYSU D00703]